MSFFGTTFPLPLPLPFVCSARTGGGGGAGHHDIGASAGFGGGAGTPFIGGTPPSGAIAGIGGLPKRSLGVNTINFLFGAGGLTGQGAGGTAGSAAEGAAGTGGFAFFFAGVICTFHFDGLVPTARSVSVSSSGPSSFSRRNLGNQSGLSSGGSHIGIPAISPYDAHSAI